MANVVLEQADAVGTALPPVCMECGAPSTTCASRTYSTDSVTLLPPILDAGLISVVLFPLWGCLAVLKLISWSSAKTMTVGAPLCHRHAHGWFVGTGIEAASITDERIVLTGVAEPFARAWEARRAVRATVPAGKARCAFCRVWNDAESRFCTQCGGRI